MNFTRGRKKWRETAGAVLTSDGVNIFLAEYSAENNAVDGGDGNCKNTDLSCLDAHVGSPAKTDGWILAQAGATALVSVVSAIDKEATRRRPAGERFPPAALTSPTPTC